MRASLFLVSLLSIAACDLFNPWKQKNGCTAGEADCAPPPTCTAGDTSCNAVDMSTTPPPTCTQPMCATTGCWEPVCIPEVVGQDLAGLWISPTGIIWIVSKQAKIFTLKPANASPRISNANATEEIVAYRPLPNGLFAVAGTGDMDVWATGEAGATMHRNMDGTWNGSAAPTTTGVIDLSPNTATDYWAIGYQDDLLRFDGARWTIEHTFGNAMSAVWASADGDAYVAGAIGFVAKYTPGGAINMPTPVTTLTLLDLHGTNRDDIWAVGGNASASVILHYNGSSWQKKIEDSSPALRSVFAEGSGMYAVGNGGRIVRYAGGANVTTETSSTTVQLNAVYGNSQIGVWAVGMSGTVLHRIN